MTSKSIDEDGVQVADERFCAFTDDKGNGPDGVYLTRSKAWDELSARMEFRERRMMLGIDRDPSDDPASGFAPGCLTMTTETVTWLRDQLTAWLDAPRLAARETPEVVASDDENGLRLLRTAHEWGVLWQDNEDDPDDDPDDGEVNWYATEAEARAAYCDETGKVSCESCARFIDHEDAEVDEDGICTCADETACSAACAANEAK